MNFSLTSSLNSVALPKPFLHHHERKPTIKLSLITCRSATNYKSSSTYKVKDGENESTNFYKLLSLNPNINTSKDEIKKAYRSMALRYHPDVCHDPSISSTKEFVRLNQAYKTLLDPVLRKEYDYELGLENCVGTTRVGFKMNNIRNHGVGAAQNRWRQQVLELKRKSNCRMAQKEGSWASRMRRAHNISNMD
ncbi:PREDICTED: chaperone protein dnaJ 20, chloroplastic-like [Prunus mume]|uniref:Chaperone protein dnaJ 20, chloroplastic-like n=1 Tax=Prunus mume TaxID=102107 RepID=A0ABM0N3H4_PRUMU|nr:PREDICTED: chaperone protein dnaJ 20, chloroplastic-like [Prunus mume]